MKKYLIIISLLLTLSLFLYGCNKKTAVSLNNENKVNKIALQSEENDAIHISVYFDTSTDNKAEVTKDERIIPKEELLGELIIQELIKGPSVKIKSMPILPKETRLLSFSIKDGIATVNLSKDAVLSMTPVKEEACLRGVIYSLTQLSSVQKVKILIESQTVETLGGNFNISKALGKDDIEGARKR